MCCKNSKNEIKFINGDSFERFFAIEGIEIENIARVTFACAARNISQDLIYVEEQQVFYLSFDSVASKNISPGFFSYDLTIELTNGRVVTYLYNEDFVVLKKRNVINEDDDNLVDEENEPPKSELLGRV